MKQIESNFEERIVTDEFYEKNIKGPKKSKKKNVEPNDDDFFDSSLIPYVIRRNLFERSNVFQQPDFGFEIDYLKPKTTARKLKVWLSNISAGMALSKFILVYIVIYMRFSAYMLDTYSVNILTTFWNDNSLISRTKKRPMLYDQKSWVFHPLTDEEEETYLLLRGRKLLEEKNKKKRDQDSERRNDKIVTTLKILNARVKILCYDIKMIMQKNDYIAKNYNQAFADKFDAMIAHNESEKNEMYSRYIDVLRTLISFKLYDEKREELTWVIPIALRKIATDITLNNIKDNIVYLFDFVNVFFGKKKNE